MEVGKRYSQTVEKSFHISMAALNASNTVKGSVTVMVEVEKACYPLCTLHTDRIPQQALDYVFTEGEEVLFYTEGNIDVHLTGIFCQILLSCRNWFNWLILKPANLNELIKEQVLSLWWVKLSGLRVKYWSASLPLNGLILCIYSELFLNWSC